MISKDLISLLDYLYNDFFVSFILCLVGIAIRDIMDSYKNMTKINIKLDITSSIFTTIILCAIRNYIDVDFNMYILICVLSGMWAFSIMGIFTNSKIMITFLSKFLKNIGNPIKAISDTAEEIQTKENHKDE